LVFVRHADRILLMKRSSDRAVWPGKLNGVGGHVEAGESLVGAARREVREETGLHVYNLRLAGLLHVTEPECGRGVLVVVFTADADSSVLVPSHEGCLAWVRREEALDLDLVPDLVRILPRLWPERPGEAFSARTLVGHAEPFGFDEPGER
jgi:8-oxo-dGTP diphosphatase